MPFKFNADGSIALADVNGAKLPVFVHPDGKEAPFDADGTLQTISARNREAQGHRERADAAEGRLAAFKDIQDPAAALKAMATVKGLSEKQLIDAGERDKAVAEAVKATQQQFEPFKTKAETLEAQLHQHIASSVFSNSKFVAQKVSAENGAAAAQIARGLFGGNVKIEDGKPVIYDANGAKVYSRIRPGELADPEEGLEVVMTSSPLWPSIAKGSNASGSGAQGGGGQGGGGKKTMTRAQFDALDPAAKAAAVKDTAITD